MRLLLTLATALWLGGCAFDIGPDDLHPFLLPEAVEGVPAPAWDDAALHAGTARARARYTLLPLWVDGEVAAVLADGDTAVRASFSGFNPGLTVLPLLPLWWSSDMRLIRRSGETARSSLVWTPLLATSTGSGWPADVPEARAWGVPLLYGRVVFGAADSAPRVDVHTSLWTLGPSWVTYDFERSSDHLEGWAFMPLTLAGLGSLVWASGEARTAASRETMHGPVNGWFGYRSVDDGHRFTRHVVAGLLWHDAVESDAEGRVHRSRHGPLWGMFGWGRSDGRAVIRLLWYPIPVE